MNTIYTSLAFTLALLSSTLTWGTTQPERPSADAAKVAITNYFGGPMIPIIMEQRVVLGTCIDTPQNLTRHQGQISCTFLLKSSGGSSESQVDFYRDGK
ncbi:MAG: hypothetical protein ACPG4U_15970, partial [Pseudomonadales bacterium]